MAFLDGRCIRRALNAAWAEFCDRLKAAGRARLQGLQRDVGRAAGRRVPIPDAEPRPGIRSRRWRPRTRATRRSTLLQPDAQARRRLRRLHLSAGLDRRPVDIPHHRNTAAPHPFSTSPCRGHVPTGPACCTSRSAMCPKPTCSAISSRPSADGSFELYIGGPQRDRELAAHHPRLAQAIHPPGLRPLGRAPRPADRSSGSTWPHPSRCPRRRR